MRKALLLDTSIGTSNIGDSIIMECVEQELAPIFADSFVFHLPTHLPAFHSYAVWRNSYAVQNYANCDYKFVGGSNILAKNMLTHYPQWNVNIFNCKPLAGSVCVGVGAGAGEHTDVYTTHLYRKILSHSYYHSVRDERSKRYVEDVLGLKAINTGCVTMWALTPDFCAQIPTKKADNVVFTLTAGMQRKAFDQMLIDILKREYDHVSLWIQGDKDEAYFHTFSNTEEIEIIPPHKAAYGEVLMRNNIEYVGTRLHGGIYALRHKKRAIILSIDERAQSISADTGLVTIEKNDLDRLPKLINSTFETKLKIPFEEIARWKAQFEEYQDEDNLD